MKAAADRTLIYLTLYLQECIAKVGARSPIPSRQEAAKLLTTSALANFALPSDPGFPLSAFYPPATGRDAGMSVARVTQ